MEKLVVVADTYPPKKDGVLTYLRSILPLLRDKYDITLIAPRFTERVEPLVEGIEVVLTPCIPIEVANYYPAIPSLKLAKHIKKADIVFINDLAPLGSASLSLAYLMGKPISLFCHHDESVMLSNAFKLDGKRLLPEQKFKRFVDEVVKRHYKCSSIIFVATRKFREKLTRINIPNDKIIYAPFAVDTLKFSPNKDNSFRETLGIGKDAKVVLNLGRMSHEKNVETVIKAAPEVIRQIGEVYFVFAGGGSKLEEYKKLATRLAIQSHCIFTGWVEWEDTPSYYSMADVFVFPSFHESQAFVVMEAMASALPVIVPAEPESDLTYYKEGENCIFLENNKDYHELAEKIVKVLQDDEYREKLCRNARLKIESYSWEEHLKRLFEGFEIAKANWQNRRHSDGIRGVVRRKSPQIL